MKKTILYILVMISLGLYFALPDEYSQSYCIICTVISIAAVCVLVQNKLSTYHSLLSFGVLFSIIILLTNYFYATYFYIHDPLMSIFQYSFSEDSINKATIISTIALSAFCIGQYEERVVVFSSIKNNFRLKVSPLETLFVFSLIGLYMFVNRHSLLSSSDDHSGQFQISSESYLKLVFIYLYYLIFKDVFQCRDKAVDIKSFLNVCNKPLLLISLLSVVYYLLSGGRVIPMRIILLYVFCYAYFIKRISNSQMFIGGIGCVFVLFLVGSLRNIWGTEQVGKDTIKAVSNVNNFLYYFKDLVINSRSLYELVSYTDQFGATWGATMMQDLLSVIPGAQSFFIRVLGFAHEKLWSGMLVNQLFFGNDNYSLGLGTNVVGDTYVAFKLVGTFILFLLLGRVARNWEYKAHTGDIVSIMMICVLSMDVVFYTRNGYLSPLRNLLWLYCFFKLETSNRKKRNIFQY